MKLYHGTPKEFDAFSYDTVGNGHDQEGPGFYFTTDLNDAKSYSRGREQEPVDGWIITIDINHALHRFIDATAPVNANHIASLIQKAPNLTLTLMDWDENPATAYQRAYESIVSAADNAHDAYQSVWYDFYRHDPSAYLKNMTSLGYTGVVINKGTLNHYVFFSPKHLRIVDKKRWSELNVPTTD